MLKNIFIFRIWIPKLHYTWHLPTANGKQQILDSKFAWQQIVDSKWQHFFLNPSMSWILAQNSDSGPWFHLNFKTWPLKFFFIAFLCIIFPKISSFNQIFFKIFFKFLFWALIWLGIQFLYCTIGFAVCRLFSGSKSKTKQNAMYNLHKYISSLFWT